MNIVTLAGILASFFTALSLLPQLLKIVRERRAGDISLLMLLSLLTGVACWIWYGLLRDDWIIVISNSISLLLNIAILILSHRFKNDERHSI